MSWTCECGDLNGDHESGCYRCGAGRPVDECPVCRGAGEVTYSLTPSIDHRDPRHETREDPCGECEGTGEVPPVGAFVEPWVEDGDPFTGAGSCPREDDYLRAQSQSRYADAIGNGFLLTVLRDGESSAPGLEAWAIALGLCWRDGMGSLCLTAAGRKRLREAGLIPQR